MGLIEQRKGEKLHTRNIEISSYICDDETIVVEGKLLDNRLVTWHSISGEKHPPDIVHQMVIRLIFDISSLTIKDIEAEMPNTPREECHEITRSLDKIKGLKIAPGFTSRIKKTFGGTKGCVHLSTLLLTMCPAAIQGQWVYLARKPMTGFSSDLLEQYLLDTCHVWRRDGQLAKDVQRAMT
ncbi:DUF2889 domain-containing protein [Desulfonema magnum]|uniref:DUF2889 n=1 Tax=Desulfonema magnum TaxID=45655 RepID=A0A975GUA3_9BACT|nr:DUF2889 domain-containing protein [Desulfonema magnum]QTA93881.1 DUF2889 [Desulfonema magnum]